jgi:predicted lipoprotein with Yx(FWY)xxD motif
MIRRRSSFIAGAVFASLTLIAAACGGSGGDSASASSSATTAKTTSTATVAVANSDLGNVLVDAQGRTLYMFGADMGTTSTCSGACAQNWPPLLATGTATVGNNAKASLLGESTRSDGKQQVTYNGHPLYLFSGDHKAGDTNGQGLNAFGGTWHALTATGNQVTATAASGSSSTGGGYGY